MQQANSNDPRPADGANSDRARDHLANERTFLAWLRTGVAMVVFGFAIGRFAIAIRQFMQIQGRVLPTAGFSVWLGTVAIIAGVFLSLAGLFRYRKTKHQLEFGRFEPAGFLVDLIGIFTALLGLALAGYLVYIELSL
jgi:putative membrane protein